MHLSSPLCCDLVFLLLKIQVLSIVPLGIGRLQNRFVVGGYVRKRVVLRISNRVENCCIGSKGPTRDSPASRELSSIHNELNKKIGPPLIILVSDFQRVLGERIPSHRLVLFSSDTERPKKILGLDFCHSLVSSVHLVLVLVVVLPLCNFIFLL